MAIRISKDLSRRDFLKFSALASAGLIIDFRFESERSLLAQFEQSNSNLLGRVFKDGTASYSDPSTAADQIALHNYNDVLDLKDAIIKKTGSNARELWYRLGDGSFLHSHDIQPVKNLLNCTAE